MSNLSFNTANQTFRQLMGNGFTYRVPMFQRNYSWTEEEWEDLWYDLLAVLDATEEPAHYLGYLVLQSTDARNYDIIDGQQRLTTLSILTLVVLKHLRDLVQRGIEPDNNQRRAEELRKIYIGYLDPVTLVTRSKMTLNRNDDRFYQNYLVPLEPLPKRNLKSSEHLLRKAFEWFSRQLSGVPQFSQDGVALARFMDTLADRLFFTVIVVTDELNAFKVFETLNARGVRLSSTDLLKNYLFSVVYRLEGHPDEIKKLEEDWEAIVDKLGSGKFPDFLRTHWNSRHPLVRHSALFKEISRAVQEKAAVFQLMRRLDYDADLYAALGNAEDELWTREQSPHIAALKLFGVSQPFTLLLAAYPKLSEAEFARLLRACVVISFRYNVIGGLSPNEQERTYNETAGRVSRGELTRSADIVRALRSIYPSDEKFKAAFSEKQFRPRSHRVARYILFHLEQHLSQKHYDFESKRYTIEHILPQNPGDAWQHFSDSDYDHSVYRLGNLTLLAKDELGNQSFEQKVAEYQISEFELTQRIAQENREWTLKRLVTRQHWMAKQATAIWRITEL